MLDFDTTHGKAEWLAYSELPLGHFADALFNAYRYADMGNRKQIEYAFHELIDREFAKWYGSAPY
jgi:hypothetical protein